MTQLYYFDFPKWVLVAKGGGSMEKEHTPHNHLEGLKQQRFHTAQPGLR